ASFGATSLGSISARPAAPAPVRAAPPPPPPTQRQPLREEAASFPTRRAGPPPSAGPEKVAVRERATFVPPLDSEWDTPAFQRRGRGRGGLRRLRGLRRLCPHTPARGASFPATAWLGAPRDLHRSRGRVDRPSPRLMV